MSYQINDASPTAQAATAKTMEVIFNFFELNITKDVKRLVILTINFDGAKLRSNCVFSQIIAQLLMKYPNPLGT